MKKEGATVHLENKLAPKVTAIFHRKSKFCSCEGRCLEAEDKGKAPVKKLARDSLPKTLKRQSAQNAQKSGRNRKVFQSSIQRSICEESLK